MIPNLKFYSKQKYEKENLINLEEQIKKITLDHIVKDNDLDFDFMKRKYKYSYCLQNHFDKLFTLISYLEFDKISNKTCLDIGTGYGYLPYMLSKYGHDAYGTDIRNSLPIYNDIHKLLKIENKMFDLKIKPHKQSLLPKKYDLITSIMIVFNDHKQNEIWDSNKWDFLIKDLFTYLNKKGKIVLIPNNESKEEFDINDVNKFFGNDKVANFLISISDEVVISEVFKAPMLIINNKL